MVTKYLITGPKLATSMITIQIIYKHVGLHYMAELDTCVFEIMRILKLQALMVSVQYECCIGGDRWVVVIQN